MVISSLKRLVVAEVTRRLRLVLQLQLVNNEEEVGVVAKVVVIRLHS